MALLQLVPVPRVGLGSLIGLHGDAVFAPVQEVVVPAAQPQPDSPRPQRPALPLAAALALSVAGFPYGRLYRRAYRREAARAEAVDGAEGPVPIAPAPAQVRAHAVLEDTVWHATCNRLVVVLLLAAFLLDRLA